MIYGNRDRIADWLNLLPFVAWDRLAEAPVGDAGEHWQVDVFGWIPRDDGRSDFVLASFVSYAEQPSFTTSSARYSKQINELLYGPEAPHYDCQRVETEFGELVRNTVALAPHPEGSTA